MNSEQLQKLMIDKLRGKLSPREEEQLNEYLNAHPEAQKEMSELVTLWSLMDNYETEPLSEDTRSHISASLKEAEAEDNSVIKFRFSFRIWAVAASILIIIGFGYLTYYYLSSYPDVQNISQTQITLFADNNAGNRIQSIQKMATQPQLPEQTRLSLLEVVNQDPNKNVRLIALETLLEFSNDQKLRKSLLKSIENQESPHVQLALIHTALRWEDASAIPYLNKLLENPETDGYIRQRIQQAIIKLS